MGLRVPNLRNFRCMLPPYVFSPSFPPSSSHPFFIPIARAGPSRPSPPAHHMPRPRAFFLQKYFRPTQPLSTVAVSSELYPVSFLKQMVLELNTNKPQILQAEIYFVTKKNQLSDEIFGSAGRRSFVPLLHSQQPSRIKSKNISPQSFPMEAFCLLTRLFLRVCFGPSRNA